MWQRELGRVNTSFASSRAFLIWNSAAALIDRTLPSTFTMADDYPTLFRQSTQNRVQFVAYADA